MSAANDQELLRAIQRQDVGALEEVYNRYGTAAFSVALRILGDRSLAEDVVQEVFLSLWRNAGKFDGARGNVKSWLLACTNNRTIDLVRQRQGKTRLDVEIDESAHLITGPDAWHEVVAKIDQAMLRGALQTLPEEQRKTLEMAYFQGYTQAEIAEAMGVPLGTVKGRTRLAFEKMRSHLESQGVRSAT